MTHNRNSSERRRNMFGDDLLKHNPAMMDIATAQDYLVALKEELDLDMLQAGLDIAGTLEPTPFADLTNAGISIGRGNYVEAGLSLLSVIPYLGDAVAKTAKGAKAAKKIAETKEKVAQVTNHIARLKKKKPKKPDISNIIVRGKDGKDAVCQKCDISASSWPNRKQKDMHDELQKLRESTKNPNMSQTKKNQLNKQKRDISEQLGNDGALHYLEKANSTKLTTKEKTFDDGSGYEMIMENDKKVGAIFKGPNTVNVVYKKSDGRVTVIEAKGGKSRLGSIKDPENPQRRIRQDDPDYAIVTAGKMAKSVKRGKEVKRVKEEWGQEILDAEERGSLVYEGVRTDYNETELLNPKKIF